MARIRGLRKGKGTHEQAPRRAGRLRRDGQRLVPRARTAARRRVRWPGGRNPASRHRIRRAPWSGCADIRVSRRRVDEPRRRLGARHIRARHPSPDRRYRLGGRMPCAIRKAVRDIGRRSPRIACDRRAHRQDPRRDAESTLSRRHPRAAPTRCRRRHRRGRHGLFRLFPRSPLRRLPGGKWPMCYCSTWPSTPSIRRGS